jgi:hypothetical protein
MLGQFWGYKDKSLIISKRLMLMVNECREFFFTFFFIGLQTNK